MTHKEGFFNGVRNTKIYYQCWLPEKQPKAVLLIAHGLTEHCGRYMNLVNHFVPLGYAVYGLDHIGHGKSDGTRGYVQHFEDFTETLDTFVSMVHDWQPTKPIFLIGHSMGGLISTIYLSDHQEKLAGVVLSGAVATIPDNVSSSIILAAKLLSFLCPKLGVSSIEAEAISRNADVVQAYLNDPFVYNGKIRAKLGFELLKAMKSNTINLPKITLPVLIVQGGDDRIVNPSDADLIYKTVSSEDKTLKVYDGLYHEVFNEVGYQKVLNDVDNWLELELSSMGKMN